MALAAAAPRSQWNVRALDIARASAVVTAVAAPISTALASISSFVFIVSLVASGEAHRIAVAGFHSTAGKAILAFLAWLALSALWNDGGAIDGLSDAWAWRKLAYLYLALPLFHDDVWKHRALGALVNVSAFAVVLAYLSVAGVLPGRTGIPGVVLANHATQGTAFAVAALCAVYLAFAAAGRKKAWYFAVAAALVIDVLFFNIGRTGYLALAGLVLAWGVLAARWRVRLAYGTGLAALLLVAYMVSPTFHGRLTQAWYEVRHAQTLKDETAMGIRVLFLQNSIDLIREKPVLGHGLGSFKRVYADYVASRYSGVQATRAGDPHNQYVYVIFEQGLVGLALFAVMLVALLKSFPRDPYGRLAACALVAWCLTSFFSSHFRTFPEGHFYAFLIGVLGAPRASNVRVSDAR